MIPQSQLYLLTAIAGIASLLWMTERRVYVSAAVSAGTWTLIAYTANSIQTTHATANAVETATHAGWMTQAVATFLAGVSFLTLFAAYFDHYPPTDRDE